MQGIEECRETMREPKEHIREDIEHIEEIRLLPTTYYIGVR